MENKPFPLSDDYIISDDRLVQICKYRQGESCCKYVVYFERQNDFYCVKHVSEVKNKIESQDMKSKGDNCEGLPG